MDKTREDSVRFAGGTTGKLSIFFGYAAGVGKLRAMLEEARQVREQGADVVVGCIKSPVQSRTAELLGGLERLREKEEFDLDAALRRRPQLLLIDGLAHANAPGSRNAKRYQDVQELFQAGSDIYTTLNVQNIESLNDTVASITGVTVKERVPDSVFDGADRVELVDQEAEDLLPGGTEPWIFSLENLTALRELALRRCADRVSLRGGHSGRSRGEYCTEEHILVCLPSSPSNAKIIRTAARMARAFQGRFTALFVETPDTAAMEDADKRRLRENIRLAQQLGASVETTFGEDVPSQIAEFARLSGASKIVIGRSTVARRWPFGKPALTERLISAAPNLDIHVILDANAGNGYHYITRGGGRTA